MHDLLSQLSAQDNWLSEFRVLADLIRRIKEGKDGLVSAIEDYNKARLKLFFKVLEDRDQDWCTYGRHAVDKGKTKLVLVSSGGRGSGPYYEYISHARIETCCDSCRLEALENQVERDDSHYRVTVISRFESPHAYSKDGKKQIFVGSRTTDYSKFDEVPFGAGEPLGIPPKLRIYRDDLLIAIQDESTGNSKTFKL